MFGPFPITNIKANGNESLQFRRKAIEIAKVLYDKHFRKNGLLNWTNYTMNHKYLKAKDIMERYCKEIRNTPAELTVEQNGLFYMARKEANLWSKVIPHNSWTYYQKCKCNQHIDVWCMRIISNNIS